MKKWIPTSIGFVIGSIVGVVCLFQPVENVPAVIVKPAETLAVLMREIFMSNSDTMAALFIEVPLIVLLPGIAGGLGGFLLGMLLSATRKQIH